MRSYYKQLSTEKAVNSREDIYMFKGFMPGKYKANETKFYDIIALGLFFDHMTTENYKAESDEAHDVCVID